MGFFEDSVKFIQKKGNEMQEKRNRISNLKDWEIENKLKAIKEGGMFAPHGVERALIVEEARNRGLL